MPRGENRPSVLLSREENELVFSLIGPKCQSLATAVVQLFTTEGPAHSEWKKRDTGVLCLIKDNGKRTYFFRIYCLYRKSLIWEHEVYLQIEYKSPRPFLHTFEAEEYMTAFNFANEDEAKLLRKILLEKMELRRIKREEKRQRAMLAARANNIGSVRQNGAVPPSPEPEPAPAPVLPPKANLSAGSNYTLKGNKKTKMRKITKADIGSPKDFKHISHVGWDAQRGFDLNMLPNEELRSFFSEAGVSETQLQDEDTRVFIYDFIETHGGLAAVKNELQHQTKPAGVSRPPPPPSSAPQVPSRHPAPAQPPAPPSRAPPPPPARAVPPPPPPPAAVAHRNPPPPRPTQPAPSSAPPSVPPPPPPGVAPPPPPPPPPPAPPAAPPPPPAPPLPSDAAVAPDARAALMDSIRSGNKTLKKVEVAPKTPPVEDSRSNLLSEIRQGVELKAVSRSGSGAGARGAACGLAGALARALEERSRAIHSSDSDTDLSDDADDEWD